MPFTAETWCALREGSPVVAVAVDAGVDLDLQQMIVMKLF